MPLPHSHLVSDGCDYVVINMEAGRDLPNRKRVQRTPSYACSAAPSNTRRWAETQERLNLHDLRWRQRGIARLAGFASFVVGGEMFRLGRKHSDVLWAVIVAYAVQVMSYLSCAKWTTKHLFSHQHRPSNITFLLCAWVLRLMNENVPVAPCFTAFPSVSLFPAWLNASVVVRQEAVPPLAVITPCDRLPASADA